VGRFRRLAFIFGCGAALAGGVAAIGVGDPWWLTAGVVAGAGFGWVYDHLRRHEEAVAAAEDAEEEALYGAPAAVSWEQEEPAWSRSLADRIFVVVGLGLIAASGAALLGCDSLGAVLGAFLLGAGAAWVFDLVVEMAASTGV